jgi:hypothetical protein
MLPDQRNPKAALLEMLQDAAARSLLPMPALL